MNQTLQKKLFDLLRQIPAGQITSYKILAFQIGISARHVGKLLHHNKNPKLYPCHRVIHNDGTLASGYAFGGPSIQQKLLEKEGIIFSSQFRVHQFKPYKFEMQMHSNNK